MNTDQLTIPSLPSRPGVYLFKNEKGGILYVGKSRSLKDRVKSYFQRGNNLTPAKQEMVQRVVNIDWVVTDSETEALLLESTLIKKHIPPYNVVLRDDRSYSYICVDYSKTYPEVYRVRRPRVTRNALPASRPLRRGIEASRGANASRGGRVTRLFGPFTSGSTAVNALWIIKKYFPICLSPNKNLKRGCFNYAIHKCPGACLNSADPKKYRRVFDDIEQFLSGNTKQLETKLRQDIHVFARREQYEQADIRKKLLLSIQNLHERQKVTGRANENADYASFVSFGTTGCVNILNVRHGSLYDQKNFLVDRIQTPAETLTQILEHYYSEASDIPKIIYTPFDLQTTRLTLESPFSKARSVVIKRVRRGERLKLLQLGERNAQEFLFRHSASLDAQTPIERLCQMLRIPYSQGFRTEIYDISHIQGSDPVGSMVVFSDSEPDKSHYRKFKLEEFGEPNDFAHMEEVLTRRFRHSPSVIPDLDRESKQKKEKGLQSFGVSFGFLDSRLRGNDKEWSLPNLIVIDGGKGQLSIAKKVLKKYQLSIPLIALAKREEEIFIPGKKDSLRIPKTNLALKFLQRMRDEAHRFGITFYRKRHRKALFMQ